MNFVFYDRDKNPIDLESKTLEELEKLRDETFANITLMDLRIAGVESLDPELIDRQRLKKLKIARKIQGRLSQTVHKKISELNKIEKLKKHEANLRKTETEQSVFVMMAREMLPNEVYLRIWREVELFLSNREDIEKHFDKAG